VSFLLLLDRDGTLMEDVGYPNNPDDVRLIPGAGEAIRHLAEAGFVPAVVSNQSGLARGLITPEQADAVHSRFVALFADVSGITLPAFYCPHGPDEDCDCRKPKTGLLKRAAEALGMTGAPGVMIGDKRSDVEAGEAMGFRALHFRGDWTAMIRECLTWAGGPK
jgi:D-glycero-D-manno-heptose 1,7-bisphosphate phosphatase